jgi:hypothetical protein
MSTLPYGPEFQDQDAFTAGRPAPHTPPMHRDEFASQGEVPPMNATTAMGRALSRAFTNIADEADVLIAAKDLVAKSEAGVDVDSDVWLDAYGRLADAVAKLLGTTVQPRPSVFDIGWPVADEETIARGIFEGGAL